MNRFQAMMYTWRHKKAFLKVEKELLGKNTIRGYLHDVDKLILYPILGKKTAHKIHRKYARHHYGNAKTIKDKHQLVIDWECARYTKPDKPLGAIEYLRLRYPNDKSLEKFMINMLNEGARQ